MMEKLLLGITMMIGITHSSKLCESNTGMKWVPDPNDCSLFSICVGNVESRYHCPHNMVVDVTSKQCVKRGSYLDRCSNVPQGLNTCKSGQKNLPVLSSCAKYMACPASLTAGRQPILECPYPKLYNERRGVCDQPENVVCGARPEPKQPCDYDVNRCHSSHCIPCHLRFPSCSGRPDGPNVWSGRERTPFYVICEKQRVVEQKNCSSDGKYQLFDPVKLKCVDFTKINI